MQKQLEQELAAKWEELQRVAGEFNALSAKAGAMDVPDYTFLDFNGQPVKLSDAFGEHEQMVLVHNMGFACPYCTLWADGFNGMWKHFESGKFGTRAKFLLVSNDTPQQQRKGAEMRGWSLPMLSCHGTTFFADLGFVGDKPEDWQPGISTLQKHPDGRLTRHACAEFGPGDLYCSLWHLFNLLPSAGRQTAGEAG